MQRIMVPHDGSDPSEVAQAVAEQLARAQQAELILVRALDQADWYSSNPDDAAAYSAAYEELVPPGWVTPESGELLDSRSLPYSIARSYWMEPATTSRSP